MTDQPGPVTADDVLASVAASVAALRQGADGDWTAPAGDLAWTCWETAEHLADDRFYYAAHLGSEGYLGYLPFESAPRYPGSEPNTIRSDPAAGPEGLFAGLAAMAALLAAIVRVSPPTVRAEHTYGPADPEGAAAMGVLETVVHTYDVARGLGVSWTPDRAVCAGVLKRLMPEVERTDDAWADLLWACGRIALPGRPRRADWRWDNTPRRAEDAVREPHPWRNPRLTLTKSPTRGGWGTAAQHLGESLDFAGASRGVGQAPRRRVAR